MSLFETIALIVASATACIILGTGVGQIRVVAKGIRAMESAGADRSKALDQRHKEAMDRLAEARAADDKRHKEAMDGLAEARAADDKRHKEAMDAAAAASAAVTAALADARAADDKRHTESMAALQELIRRTSPPAERPGD